MKLRNENLEYLSTNEKLDLINEIANNPDLNVTEDEAQEALAQLVYQGELSFNQEVFKSKSYAMPKAKGYFSEKAVKLNLWGKLLMNVCSRIDEDTEREKIAEIVVDAVAQLVPFGIIIKGLLKKVVSYFLKVGYSTICGSEEVEKSVKLNAKEKIKAPTGEPEFINEAVKIANEVLANEEFYNRIAEKKDFDESDITGKVLSNLIKMSTVEAYVDARRKAWPWSASNAYTTPQKPNRIRLNKWKFDDITSAEQWAVTLVHEYVHLVDFEHSNYDFGHGSNRRTDKENTAPYWVEEVAKKIINN